VVPPHPDSAFTANDPAVGRQSELRAPTTVLVGVRDNPSSRVFADRAVRSVSGARLVTVPGADHLVELSRPDAFDAALTSALDALE
jgi:pimeloyl-ACP methyl ester carboxylesterase